MIVRKASLLMMGAAVLCMLCSAAYAVTYQYDTQNRLIKGRFDDGTVEEYTYDKAGNRQVKIGRVSDNNPPVAQDDAVATWENNPCLITLVATDADEDPLTYFFESDPGHGTLSGTPPNLTYTPDTQYDGPDSFQFKVHDGEDESNVATVSISMTNVNLAPVAYDQCLSTNKNAALSFTLEAEDPDEAPVPLTYTLVSEPENGVLSGTIPDFTYTPNTGFEGHEIFTFKVNDGLEDSNTATVGINIETFVPVMWVDAVGVEVSGGTLTKTTGNAWGNAGAASDQVIYGDGAVEFFATDYTDRIFGLTMKGSQDPENNQFDSIDYAIALQFSSGWSGDYFINICENESWISLNHLPYVVGDRFTIERTGTTVVYKRNGAILRTSLKSSSGPLIADASIYHSGGTIADATIIGGRGADIDHDLDVDADDRALLMQDMGRTDCPQETDLNADGQVDENDLAIFDARYDAGEDTDNDGITDDVEDADGDGVVDVGETDWQSADTDGDGIQDGTELGYTLDDIGPKTDEAVFIPDADPSTQTDPLLGDTDGDGLIEGEEDTNFNGQVDAGETDPNDADSDGLSDDIENGGCTDPNDADTDADGISDGVEDSNNNGQVDSGETNPCNNDTDGDGFTDGEEDENQNGTVDTGESNPAVADINVVSNPSIETGGWYPYLWYTYSNDLTRHTGYITGEAHTGNKSITIRRATAIDYSGWYGATIDFSAPYPTSLSVSGWAKAESVTAPASGTGWFGIVLKVVFEDDTEIWHSPANLAFTGGTHDWERVVSTDDFAQGIKSVVPYCIFNQRSGTAWFDDIVVIKY